MIRFALVGLSLFSSVSSAQIPNKETFAGSKMIEKYFQLQSQQIADECLKEVKTKEQWEKARPQFRQQLLEMLGLWPMPPKTDLNAKITGKVERAKFIVEKLHFQSIPNLYVTANLYIPKPVPKNAPTILYLCGHGNVVKDGISYGSKVHYQHHPAWFAEHGYVALIIDTLQLSEIPGIHHGTYREKMWWWHTLGYTPAGIECWNAIRALDYLQTRPEVDMKRVGVTGRSGGGAYSWWIAATDDRPACIHPVAGIADLHAHLNEGYPGRLDNGVIGGHCDCMFMVNKYRWDFPLVAALCAPRPLLLGNSDQDEIFPVAGYRRMVDKVQKIYDLYGATNKFQLLETKGPHLDTLDLRFGAYRWMNKWLKNDSAEVSEAPFQRFLPQELKVFDKIPEGAINAQIQDYFIKPAILGIPQSKEVAQEWWVGTRTKLETLLHEQVFLGWPKNSPDLNVRPVADRTNNGIRLRAYDFISEQGIDLRLWLMTSPTMEKPSLVVLNVLDDAGYQEWCRELGPEFKEALGVQAAPILDESKFKQNRRVLEGEKWAFAAICPRGIGSTKWAESGSTNDTQIRRRFALIGQTLDGQRVWDVRQSLKVLRTLSDLKDVPLWLEGKRELAGIALYASLFESDVKRLDLWHLPASHHKGPTLLHVRRYLDIPQAVGLAFPKSINIYVWDETEAKNWDWPLQLQKVLGKEYLSLRIVGE